MIKTIALASALSFAPPLSDPFALVLGLDISSVILTSFIVSVFILVRYRHV